VIVPKKRVLTINEAAKLIDGLTPFRVRQMCISGQLPCFMAGRKYLIYEENLYRVVLCEDTSKDYEQKSDNIAN
jgi:hypothetical protein